jgi:glycerophosphoryl diester phosphodiesterase
MPTNPLADLNARLVVGHRGDRTNAPENTIESLARALEKGADALEFDVRATRDGVAVLMHDPTVDRTTNGRGRVREQTAAELRTLDASRGSGAWVGARCAVPTLEEVLDRFRGTPMILDVKELAVTESTIQLIHKMGLQGSVVVGSDDHAVCERLERSGIPSCASPTDCLMLLALALAGTEPVAPRYSVLSITPNPKGFPIPMMRMLGAARRAAIPSHVWTINDVEQAKQLFAAGVTCVLTDNPSEITHARPT